MTETSVKEVGRLKGLIPATFTPLRSDGEIHLELIPDYVTRLTKDGIEYVFVNGTTGEGPSFTVEERKRLAEAWLRSAEGTLSGVMVHVGAGNSREACELARHAEERGAIAISAAPTTYFKPASAEDLLAYCKVIAAAAPSLPFYYYHIPRLTGCGAPVDEFYALAVRDIPNFRGVKFSSVDVVDLGACLKLRNRHPRHEIFWGVDEVSIVALDHGLECCIGSTYNMMAPIGQLIMELQRRGERAAMMDWLFVVQDLVKMYKKQSRGGSSLMAVMKTATSMVMGLELGPVRLPLAPLDDKSDLSKALETFGVVEKIEEARIRLAELK